MDPALPPLLRAWVSFTEAPTIGPVEFFKVTVMVVVESPLAGTVEDAATTEEVPASPQRAVPAMIAPLGVPNPAAME